MDEVRYRAAEERWLASEGLEPLEQRVHLPRLDVDVRIQEVGDGPAVLFLHGGPNSGSTWAGLAARLVGLRCLLLDRPGTGLSDALPRPVDASDLASFASTLAVDVLDAMEIDRAHLVASSFGGLVALHSVAAHPGRFDRMVQMACPAMVPGMLVPPFMRLIMTPGVGPLIGALPPTRAAARSILRQIGHGASLDAGRIPDAFLDWYLALQRHTDTMVHEGRMIAGFGGPFGFDRDLTVPDDVFERVVAPTLFLWGRDDTFGGEEVARRTAAAMPDAEVVMLPGAGHLPWVDAPDVAAARTQAFLTGDARTPDVSSRASGDEHV